MKRENILDRCTRHRLYQTRTHTRIFFLIRSLIKYSLFFLFCIMKLQFTIFKLFLCDNFFVSLLLVSNVVALFFNCFILFSEIIFNFSRYHQHGQIEWSRLKGKLFKIIVNFEICWFVCY